VKKIIEKLEQAKRYLGLSFYASSPNKILANIDFTRHVKEAERLINETLAELKTPHRETPAEESLQKLDQDKFIVINRKHLDELNRRVLLQISGDGFPVRAGKYPAVLELEKALQKFRSCYEREICRPLNQRYIVCNQDEPYAEEVAAIILGAIKKAE
jgi:hypothetical protein